MVRRIALADPAHVPAGVYARQALECEGRWEEVSDRVVPTLDVRAALAAVEEGAADAAIVYSSDALHAPDLAVSPAVPDSCQPRIIYTAGLGENAQAEASDFLRYMDDPARDSVWIRYGFDIRRQ